VAVSAQAGSSSPSHLCPLHKTMAPKRLARSKGPLRRAGQDLLKGKPGSAEIKAAPEKSKMSAPLKAAAANGTTHSKDESAKLVKLLEDIFKMYDQDEDGRIERVEWLEGEERRLGKLGFGPKVRRASVHWFKEAGAEGTVTDGMFLDFEKFKTAYLTTSVQESGIPANEPLKLSEWIMEEKAQGLFRVCCKTRPSLTQNTSELLPPPVTSTAAAPRYPITCTLRDVVRRFEEARQFGKMVLVLQNGKDDVETFMKYRNYVPIDSKQILSEMLIRKSKSKEECAAEVGQKLRSGMYSNGFCKPLWIHMGNSAFNWNGFCCEEFPDEVFSGSRWTIENAFKRGMIDDTAKMMLEINNEEKWQDFQLIITSRFDLEGAEEHLKDKIPFYNELAIISVDIAD